MDVKVHVLFQIKEKIISYVKKMDAKMVTLKNQKVFVKHVKKFIKVV